MQRNQFKTTVAHTNVVNFVKRSTLPRVNTFSDCIKDASYTTVNKKMIRVRNREFDSLEDLV